MPVLSSVIHTERIHRRSHFRRTSHARNCGSLTGMDIQFVPELEDLVERYQSADEYVGQAVSLLQAHATWFAEDRAEISSETPARFAATKPVS